MFWERRLRTHPEFMAGARGLLPQVPGLSAWALMTGVAMAKSGLSLAEALAMGLLVYAGSSQLASLPLLVAGAPAWVVLATGFCVNLRFVVFSLHLRGYLMHLPRWQRLITGYFATDMGYVLLTQRHPVASTVPAERLAAEAYMAGCSAVNWVAWLIPCVAGTLLANFIPQHWGLSFAGILCLLGIMCSLASTRLRVVSMAVAGVVGVLAYSAPLKLNIVLAIGVAVLACLVMEQRTPQRVRT